MFSLISQASETTSKSKVGQISYELGYFIGSHLIEILIGFILIAAVILYFAVFRKKDLDW